MPSVNNNRTVYYIPDNFREEGRIFQGSVKIRNLLQGAVLALPFGIIGWKLGNTLASRISIALFAAGPIVCAGIMGYNDDPLFSVIGYVRNWLKTRTVRKYNPNPAPFYVSPVEAIFAEEPTKDKLVGRYEDWQKQKMEERLNEEMVEGETFVFADDPVIRKYHDESQRPSQSNTPHTPAVVRIEEGDIDDIFGFEMDWRPHPPGLTLDMGDDDIL